MGSFRDFNVGPYECVSTAYEETCHHLQSEWNLKTFEECRERVNRYVGDSDPLEDCILFSAREIMKALDEHTERV